MKSLTTALSNSARWRIGLMLETTFAVMRTRLADYMELTKPRVGALVLFTVAAGYWLAARGAPHLVTLCHTLFGTSLVVAGASALNQFLERCTDGLMQRTQSRPLPSGRLQPLQVVLFGLILGGFGIGYLFASLPQSLTALIAGFSLVSYVFIYTPLKKITSLNTLVGAIPGALPPVIGWTAVTNSITWETSILFLILFFWQIPHFLAIAWIYRDEYARAGLKMLPVVDVRGGITGRQMILYSLALIPISVVPALLRSAGPFYLAGAMLLGTVFLFTTLRFYRNRSLEQARRVLHASLIYLPALLVLLLLDSSFGHAAVALQP
jgi:protoheme IX farnesyltransferase